MSSRQSSPSTSTLVLEPLHGGIEPVRKSASARDCHACPEPTTRPPACIDRRFSAAAGVRPQKIGSHPEIWSRVFPFVPSPQRSCGESCNRHELPAGYRVQPREKSAKITDGRRPSDRAELEVRDARRGKSKTAECTLDRQRAAFGVRSMAVHGDVARDERLDEREVEGVPITPGRDRHHQVVGERIRERRSRSRAAPRSRPAARARCRETGRRARRRPATPRHAPERSERTGRARVARRRAARAACGSPLSTRASRSSMSGGPKRPAPRRGTRALAR